MSDEFFRKQLEEYGIEHNRVINTPIEEKRKKDALDRRQDTIKKLMSMAAGRELMAYWLDVTLAFTSPFAPGKPDYSAFLAGAQAIGLLMFRDIMSVAPEKYYEMVLEAQARKENIIPTNDEEMFT